MSRRLHLPARARIYLTALTLTIAVPASASDAHVTPPPQEVTIGTKVCNSDYLLESDLLATICRTTYVNHTPNGQKAHVHVTGTVENKSSTQRPYFLIKMEVLDESEVKLLCEFRQPIKPTQKAHCAGGVLMNPIDIPNMRVQWDFHSDDI